MGGPLKRLEDIFDLQDRVTASVVGTIGPNWSRLRSRARKRREPRRLRPLSACIIRHSSGNQRVRDGSAAALYGALNLDPEFSSAYGMATLIRLRKWNGWVTNHAHEIAQTDVARRAAASGKDAVALCTGGSLAHVVGNPTTVLHTFIALSNSANSNCMTLCGWAPPLRELKLRLNTYHAPCASAPSIRFHSWRKVLLHSGISSPPAMTTPRLGLKKRYESSRTLRRWYASLHLVVQWQGGSMKRREQWRGYANSTPRSASLTSREQPRFADLKI